MKLYIFISLIFFSLSSFAQNGISIMIDGQTTELSGGTYTMTAPSMTTFDVPFDIYNNTGLTRNWRITRTRLSVPTGWTDAFCWGHATDPFGGTCYSSGQMATNPWTTPASALFPIGDGEYGKLKVAIDPDDFVSGTAHYRYYVSSDGINFVDSVDLIIEFIAAVKPLKDVASVTIAPNPTSDYLNITLSGAETASMKMVDVLGNVIFKENINSNKKLDVSEFKSGVYFITFEGQNFKPFNRKVIIRH